MSDAGVLRGVAYHANGHPRHDHDLVASDSTYWWSKQGSDLVEVRRFDPAAENASSAPPITLDVKYGAEGAVVGVEIVERDGVPDLVEDVAHRSGGPGGQTVRTPSAAAAA